MLLKNQTHPNTLVVVPQLTADSMTKDSLVISCRLVGGFLTSSAWLEQSVVNSRPPEGLYYQGIRHRQLTLSFSKALAESMPEVHDLFKVIGHHTVFPLF